MATIGMVLAGGQGHCRASRRSADDPSVGRRGRAQPAWRGARPRISNQDPAGKVEGVEAAFNQGVCGRIRILRPTAHVSRQRLLIFSTFARQDFGLSIRGVRTKRDALAPGAAAWKMQVEDAPSRPRVHSNCCSVMPSALKAFMIASDTFCTVFMQAISWAALASSRLRAGLFGTTSAYAPRSGHDVHEGNRFVVFVNFVCRQLAAQNFGENVDWHHSYA